MQKAIDMANYNVQNWESSGSGSTRTVIRLSKSMQLTAMHDSCVMILKAQTPWVEYLGPLKQAPMQLTHQVMLGTGRTRKAGGT